MTELKPCPFLLGEKVQCSSYLRRIKDGLHISRCTDYYKFLKSRNEQFRNNPPETDYFWDHFLNWDEEVEKTYFRQIEKCFSGIVVGRKKICVKANFYVTSVCDGLEEYEQICKKPIEIVDCVLVFYAMGKRRLVPINRVNKEGER